MPEKFVKIKEVSLKNNCPVCYSNEHLRLSFSQKVKSNKFYRSMTSEVSYEMTCENCDSIIYPVQWDDDIERVFEYQRKAFQAKKPSFYLKKLSWVVILFVGIILIAAIITLSYKHL